MKTERSYVLAVYSLNLMLSCSLLSVFTDFSGVYLLTISLIFTSFTSSAAFLVFWLWMVCEEVLFITKDCIHEDEKD